MNVMDIPVDQEDWAYQEAKLGLRNKSIRQLTKLESASEMTNDQFLLLKVFWCQTHTKNNLQKRRHEFGLDATWDTAGQKLISLLSGEFGRSLDLLETNVAIQDLTAADENWPGAFTPVKRQLQQLMESFTNADTNDDTHVASPRVRPPADTSESEADRSIKRLKTRSGRISRTIRQWNRRIPKQMEQDQEKYPQLQDEMVVNAFFILLLQELGGLVPTHTLERVINRVCLRADFNDSHGFTAETDGALWTRPERQVLAIIEVKKRLRAKIYRDVRKQESGEAAVANPGTPEGSSSPVT